MGGERWASPSRCGWATRAGWEGSWGANAPVAAATRHAPQVGGTAGTLQVADFVIPRDEQSCRWGLQALLAAGGRLPRTVQRFGGHPPTAAGLPPACAPTPAHPSQACSFVATSNHRLAEWDCTDATQRDEVTVLTPKPQARVAGAGQGRFLLPRPATRTQEQRAAAAPSHLQHPRPSQCVSHARCAQEVHMWEAFCALVRRVKEGRGGPDPRWPCEAALTQRVLFAVEQSARDGCRPVALG